MQRLLLVLQCSLIVTAPALAARSRVAVDVRSDGDTFSINATLFAPVPLELSREVLTDFEHMEQFDPERFLVHEIEQQFEPIVEAMSRCQRTI